MTDRFDLKLFLLRFIRRFYMLFVGAAIGALLVGGIYLFVQLVVKPVQYTQRVVIHQELHYNDWNGQYTYVNGYTMDQMLGMDWVTEEVSKNLGGKISPDDLRDAIHSDLLSDTRVLYFNVTAGTPERTEEIFEAFIPVLKMIPEKLGEIDDLIIIDKDDVPTRVNNIGHIARALLLGALLGACTAAFILSVLILVDDSQYIPQLFEEKYGLPCDTYEGTVPEGVSAVAKSLLNLKDCIGKNGEIYVEAGAHNGKILDNVLFEAKKQNITISKVYIVNPVKWIVKGYYAASKFPNPFLKQE